MSLSKICPTCDGNGVYPWALNGNDPWPTLYPCEECWNGEVDARCADCEAAADVMVGDEYLCADCVRDRAAALVHPRAWPSMRVIALSLVVVAGAVLVILDALR